MWTLDCTIELLKKNLDSSYFDEINWKIDFQVLLLLTRWRWGWFNYICALELHWIPIQLKVKLGLPIAAVVVEGKNWPHLKIRSTWSDWSFPLLANAYLRSFLHDFSHLHNGYHSTCSKGSDRTLPKVFKSQREAYNLPSASLLLTTSHKIVF